MNVEHAEKKANAHQLILQDRHTLEMTGIADVDSFDDTTIVARADFGELIIRGSGLHIVRLDLECGILSIEGEIGAMEYIERHTKSGLIGRIFR